ncbi:hypothetical protein BH10PSE18_BH10PSE18_37810 [soil metagenome]
MAGSSKASVPATEPGAAPDPAALFAALRRHRPDATGVAALRAISGGASQEIWSFDARLPSGDEGLILRRTRRWSDTGQQGSAGMAAEAALLRAAAMGGVPVPRVVGALAPADGLGDGYLMQRVEGESSARVILRDARFAEARRTLAATCGGLMARIHRLPSSHLPTLRVGGAAQECAQWAAAHRANGTLRPVFELALRWLAENEPSPCAEPVLVHGDFRNGNLMVGPEGVRAVLDWELAHLGDPMEDLGWFCVNSWRFGQVGLEAGGLGTRAQFFAGYEAEAGRPVDAARVHYWQVLGTLKWGVTCDAMGLAWRSGSDRNIERLAVARRASEAEIDLLVALDEAPRLSTAGRCGDVGVAGVDRAAEVVGAARDDAPEAAVATLPGSADEIVEAVAALLRAQAEATAATHTAPDGTRRFQARIGASLMDTLRRERALGPAAVDAERERLGRLMARPIDGPICSPTGASNDGLADLNLALCRQIQRGLVAVDDEALRAHLRATVLARLAIDQPRYAWDATHRHC